MIPKPETENERLLSRAWGASWDELARLRSENAAMRDVVEAARKLNKLTCCSIRFFSETYPENLYRQDDPEQLLTIGFVLPGSFSQHDDFSQAVRQIKTNLAAYDKEHAPGTKKAPPSVSQENTG